MTRTIKASEVKPGMEVEFTLTRRMTIHKNVEGDYSERELEDVSGSIVFVGADTQVTVLSEPQPEEPTAGGARVVVGGRRFLRADGDSLPWVELDVWEWYWWDYLCNLGQVTVIPDQGWTVPEDTETTPEVPDRIEEWPDDDEHRRRYAWRDEDGEIWRYGSNSHGDGWICGYVLRGRPFYGPWTRVPLA